VSTQAQTGLRARRAGEHPLAVIDDGVVEYHAAMGRLDTLVAARQADEVPDTLWLLSHPPTYTVGRRTPAAERPSPGLGIPVVEVRRGGKLTYHSPGQVVGYPVLRLREPIDVVGLIRDIEHVLIAVLGDLGIPAERRDTPPGQALLTGVWVEHRKIASLGMYVSRGVSAHGFAMDVDADAATTQPWTWVVPCGLPDVEMTSVAAERERRGLAPVTQADVRRLIVERFD
jgi:lipoyl(octanoyl) transferase